MLDVRRSNTYKDLHLSLPPEVYGFVEKVSIERFGGSKNLAVKGMIYAYVQNGNNIGSEVKKNTQGININVILTSAFVPLLPLVVGLATHTSSLLWLGVSATIIPIGIGYLTLKGKI